MKKLITIASSIAVLIAIATTIYFLIRNKKIDYEKLIDEDCGFEISKYLEFEKADYENADSYDLQFKVKKGLERELEGIMDARYHDDLLENHLVVHNASMKKLIDSGSVKHIYSFMREGKVKNPFTGERILSIPIQIVIVDVEEQWYAIFSAI